MCCSIWTKSRQVRLDSSFLNSTLSSSKVDRKRKIRWLPRDHCRPILWFLEVCGQTYLETNALIQNSLLFETQTVHKSLLRHNCIVSKEERGHVSEYSNEKPTSVIRFVFPKLHFLRFKSRPRTENTTFGWLSRDHCWPIVWSREVRVQTYLETNARIQNSLLPLCIR